MPFPAMRAAQTGVWTGDELIVFEEQGLPFAFSVEPEIDSWDPLPLLPGPDDPRTAVYGGSAVWTGQELWVRGGYTTTGPDVDIAVWAPTRCRPETTGMAGTAYPGGTMDAADLARRLTLNDEGLVPAIVQQHDTREVLMMAWMTPETLAETIDGGQTVFWSRSRNERWHKGATSGNVQRVIRVDLDCDGDVVLVTVDQGDGVACHTGARTCFEPLTPP